MGILVASTLRCAAHSPPTDGSSSHTNPEDARRQALARQVTIYRDAYGVPHVFGPTDAAVVFGATYARAEDEFHYVEAAVIKLLGRASEVGGPDWLSWDVFLRKLEIESHARREYARAPGAVRALCDAFADGLNHFLATSNVKPKLLDRFEPWHALVGYRLFHVSGIDAQSLAELGQTGVLDKFTGYLSSTMWALGPSKTASGGTLLMINPHIPLDAPYEFSLHSAQGLNVSGQTAYGIGVLPISGHNGRIGWSLTANEPDINDVYREAFSDTDATRYRFGRDLRPITQWQARIAIKTKDGTRIETHTFAKTHHGPLFTTKGGERLALKVAKLDEGGVLAQFYAMSKADTLDAFKDAIAPMNLTYNNVMYAGRDGHIFYVYGGAIPRRNINFDWSKPVDGANPATEWGPFLPLAELPQLQDPSAGYLQNSNSSPFRTTATENPSPTDRTRLFNRDQDTPIAQRSRRLLQRLQRVSFDEWATLAFDTYLPTAEDDIKRLNAEFEAIERTDPKRATNVRPAITLLNDWDRRATIGSVATTLYVGLFHSSSEASDFPMLDRLDHTMQRLKQRYGDWRTPYGDLNQLRRPTTRNAVSRSLPTAGVPFYMGSVFTFNTGAPDDAGVRYGQHGHSFVSVVEFGTHTTRAASVLALGQSRDPNSPHYFDQAPLYAAGGMKQAWFQHDAIKDHAIRCYHPGHPPASEETCTRTAPARRRPTQGKAAAIDEARSRAP